MSRVLIFGVFLIHIQTSFTLHCDEAIVPGFINNLEDIVGVWNYLYHLEKSSDKSVNSTVPFKSVMCRKIEISHTDKDYIEAKKANCGNIYVPFDWNDVRLKIIAPELLVSNAVIVDGIDQYVMETCGKYSLLDALRINDEYILLVNNSESMMELLGKVIPNRDELVCIIEKLEKVKYFENIAGKAYCFQ